jgi:hypothetical protein
MLPSVHNKYHGTAPVSAVYCGRGSRYGNPFVIGRDGDRDEVCDKFEQLILPDLDVSKLRGKDLVCFCKPKRCHCDSIIRKANLPLAINRKKLRTAIFDIESDGLLDRITKVHVLCIKEFETGKKFKFLEHEIEEGLELLRDAEMVVAHNGLGFDIPALFKLYPDFEINGKIRDSLVMTRVMFSHQKELDFRLYEKGMLPSEFIGKHSLDSWGYRIGKYKGDYSKIKRAEAKALGITDEDELLDYVWGHYTPELGEYCENDVEVTDELWKMLLEQDYPEFPIVFEHEFADYCVRQEANGFPFNTEAAQALEADLRGSKDIIVTECEKNFPSRLEASSKTTYGKLREEFNAVDWDKIDNPELEDMVYDLLSGHDQDKPVPTMTIPKKTLRYKDPARGDRTAGCPFTPVYFKEFNPGSRQQVATRLMEQGWEPTDFTEKGNIKIDDIILKNAAERFPIAATLADYFGVNKTLGQLADGDNGWLKLVTPENKIHHYVNPCGAVTGRCTHAKPNLGQVPAISKDKEKNIKMGRDGGWGFECRSLFYTTSPFVMMGSDLSGIELRCLAHYMAEFDNGEYAKELLEGDIHTVNMNAAGLESRDQAKTFIYACLTFDTIVLTASGWKSFDKLVDGEAVWSWNSIDRVMEYCPITEKVSYGEADIWTVNTDSGNIRCTPNHRWYLINGKVIEAQDLIAGDQIRIDEFSYARVLTVTDLKQKAPVWCIGTVNNTFYCRSATGYQGITGNTLYGAGPQKIGSIVLPFASEAEQTRVGKELLDRFLRNMPALKKLMKNLKNEARRGFIIGLDGRRLYIRAQHAALNTLLQNAGAMIAKKWVLLFEQYMEAEGYVHGWDGDFAMMAFVHDEIQVSVMEALAQMAGETSQLAAADAGDFFGFKLPVAAEYKIGLDWGQTH